MANTRFIREDISSPSDRPLFVQVVVTLFVGILALAALAPSVVTAAVGIASCTLGLILASVLWLTSDRADPRTAGWDLAGAAVFLGFIAILVSDAIPAL